MRRPRLWLPRDAARSGCPRLVHGNHHVRDSRTAGQGDLVPQSYPCACARGIGARRAGVTRLVGRNEPTVVSSLTYQALVDPGGHSERTWIQELATLVL